jgi:hypothetical protein
MRAFLPFAQMNLTMTVLEKSGVFLKKTTVGNE